MRSIHDRRGAGRIYSDRAFNQPCVTSADAGAIPVRSRLVKATRKLVEGYFMLKALGPTRIKGVERAGQRI